MTEELLTLLETGTGTATVELLETETGTAGLLATEVAALELDLTAEMLTVVVIGTAVVSTEAGQLVTSGAHEVKVISRVL